MSIVTYDYIIVGAGSAGSVLAGDPSQWNGSYTQYYESALDCRAGGGRD